MENQNKEKDNNFYGVLILENKSDLRAFYAGTLTKSGKYFIKTSATAQEALDLLEQEYPNIDLIVFDWDMQDIPGSVFAQKVRGNSLFDHIEMLIVSDKVSSEDSFLITELDIHFTMQKIANAAEYSAKIEEVRNATNQVSVISSKLKEIQHLINQDKIEDLEELLGIPEIVSAIETNPRFVHLGGEVRLLKKQYEESVKFLQDFFDQNKGAINENLKSLSTLGKALCFCKKFDEALMIFERLESKSPKNLSYKISVGDALLGLENLADADKKFDQVLEEDPNNTQALVGKGKVAAIEGDFESSQSFFQKIHGSFESRTLASFFNNRGVSMIHKGKIQEAILFYENAIQFLDKYKGHVYFNLGLAYFRSGNIMSAANCFNVTLSTPDAQVLAGKKILQEYKEKGQEKFIQDYQNQKQHENT